MKAKIKWEISPEIGFEMRMVLKSPELFIQIFLEGGKIYGMQTGYN